MDKKFNNIDLENEVTCLKCENKFIDEPKIKSLVINELNKRIFCNDCVKEMTNEKRYVV